jgi:hypothetical protein
MTDPTARRAHLERLAVTTFAVAAIVEAVVCGAVIVSGWFAGVMDDRYERVFWAGAVLSFVMVAVLASAAVPGGGNDVRVVRRITWTLRVGLALFVLSPALCIGSLIADFYG